MVIKQSVDVFGEQRKFTVSSLNDINTKSHNIKIPKNGLLEYGRLLLLFSSEVLPSWDLLINSICDLRQNSTLIDELSNYTEYNAVDVELSHCISSMKQAISLVEQVFGQSGTYKFHNLLSQLYFILGELENSTVKKTRRLYNMATMILSLKCHLSSFTCYTQLRNKDCVFLPHESSLFQLYSNFGLDTDFLTYLRAETTEFNQYERHVCLNIDEIHVKSCNSCKGGRFIGTAEYSKSDEIEAT
ncbi:hypothetical protein LOD99_5338 [Oopsacas minuta]|uniref:Uncharacterized protein n=1 Tax=Oopsacas minuta TaxID=111878 RepID=A0AAV7JSJ3_9METZ|nr:hypothetical protein LOD99_5338 [Oopsacas minuta]